MRLRGPLSNCSDTQQVVEIQKKRFVFTWIHLFRINPYCQESDCGCFFTFIFLLESLNIFIFCSLCNYYFGWMSRLHCCIYNIFKNIIKSNYDIQNVPIHLCVGDRKSNILSTKLRNRCSELNTDLFRVNLIDSAACSCGCNIEDARHFIFIYTKYQKERQLLLRSLGNFHPITLDTLLFGNDRFNSNDNITIQIALQKYIIDTERFT